LKAFDYADNLNGEEQASDQNEACSQRVIGIIRESALSVRERNPTIRRGPTQLALRRHGGWRQRQYKPIFTD
jgi:hypothetical protein